MDDVRKTVTVQSEIIKIKVPAQFLHHKVEVLIRPLAHKKKMRLSDLFAKPFKVGNRSLPTRDELHER